MSNTLDKARAEAGRLRERFARVDEVLVGLAQARNDALLARDRSDTVKNWSRALTLLTDTLNKLQIELGSNLAPRITKELEAILHSAPISGIAKASLDANLTVHLDVAGAPPGLMGEELTSRLSLGAQRQLALALRAAVAKALGDDAAPPMLLDEPLAELDDERALDCLNFLQVLTARHQVVIATCHRVQYEWLAGQSKAEIHQVTLA
jgi:recombinational DNA repair ATPase RecF